MIRIAVIADTHRSFEKIPNGRRGEIADVALLKTVRRLNRFIKPDIVLMPGDVLDRGQDPGAETLFQEMGSTLDHLKCPSIVLPGNHDGDPDEFYKYFEKPPDFLDVNGVRFVPFIDPEEPHYNARRTEEDLQRMAGARQGFDGPLVSVQHVPLFPPGTHSCPYNYTNIDEILPVMRDNGYVLSLSGHYHHGMDVLQEGKMNFAVAPSLCDAPFRFSEIVMDGEKITQTTHRLQVPPELGLVDCHIHTRFAYCNENMDFVRVKELAKSFGLADWRFCEHTGQLYFGKDDFWGGVYAEKGIEGADPSASRMAEYLAEARNHCARNQIGFEVDSDYRGRMILRDEDRQQASLLIGSMHRLPEMARPEPSIEKAAEEFLGILEQFLKSGIRVLAHPFRLFRRGKMERPDALIEPVVRLLKENGVAAEVNFHTHEPAKAFIERCLDANVKLAFGSDAHNLYEVGELAPHLELLRSCGCDEGRLKDMLLNG